VTALADLSQPAIAAEHVLVRAGDITLLHGVSLDVAPGEWLNIVGPNGAGKTTFLRVLAGLQRAEGTLRIGGRPASGLGRRQWSRLVGLVPQVPLVPAGIRVFDYVLLGRTPHIHPLGRENQQDVDASLEALEQLGLDGFAERVVDTLSGGERQRVLVARLLAQDAPIALLDEPTSALDVGHQQQVLDLVDELRRTHGLTVVATMHDLTMAGQYGDRVALVAGGSIAAVGAAVDVLEEALLSAHYGARLRVERTSDGPVVVPVREHRERI
jgi:iron complex transport system ATP-binding protein